MSMGELYLSLILMALALVAGLWAYAWSLTRPHGRHRMLFEPVPAGWPRRRGRHADLTEERHGVHEHSPTLVSVMAEAGAFELEPPVLTAPTTLDAEASAILDRFQDYVNEWRTAPGYLVDFQGKVDAAAHAAGHYDEEHRRWRARAWDAATGEYVAVGYTGLRTA